MPTTSKPCSLSKPRSPSCRRRPTWRRRRAPPCRGRAGSCTPHPARLLKEGGKNWISPSENRIPPPPLRGRVGAGGRARTHRRRPSPAHHVARRLRQLDGEAVELLGHDDLAAEPRGLRQAEGEVEHVLLVLGRVLQQLVPFRIDDDVAGRAGERALAGALDVDAVLVRDLQDREAERCVHFASLPVALDESHFRHGPILAIPTRSMLPTQTVIARSAAARRSNLPRASRPHLREIVAAPFGRLAMTANRIASLRSQMTARGWIRDFRVIG